VVADLIDIARATRARRSRSGRRARSARAGRVGPPRRAAPTCASPSPTARRAGRDHRGDARRGVRSKA
jgi:hypothetical protein